MATDANESAQADAASPQNNADTSSASDSAPAAKRRGRKPAAAKASGQGEQPSATVDAATPAKQPRRPRAKATGRAAAASDKAAEAVTPATPEPEEAAPAAKRRGRKPAAAKDSGAGQETPPNRDASAPAKKPTKVRAKAADEGAAASRSGVNASDVGGEARGADVTESGEAKAPPQSAAKPSLAAKPRRAVKGRTKPAGAVPSPAKAAARTAKGSARRKEPAPQEEAGTDTEKPVAERPRMARPGPARPRPTGLARIPIRSAPAEAAPAKGKELQNPEARKKWDPLAPYRRVSENLMIRMRPEKLTTPEKVIEGIARGPQGPNVIAAFDFDGTLVGGFTGAMLMQERMKRKEVSRAELVETAGVTFKAMAKLLEANEVVAHSMAQWAGKSEEEMQELSSHLFENKIQDAVFPEMRQILDAHRAAGHTIVVATSASSYQVEPTVKSLGIDHLLCTEVEVAEGKLTGKLVGDSLFGAGKVAAIKKFVAEQGSTLADTHFYADGDEEVGLMEAVGFPHPTNPARKLADAARSHGWPVLRLQSRGSAKPGNFVRSIVGLASILPILQAGLAVGLLTRDKRQAANLIMPTWIKAQLDLAKVKLRVSGRRNLFARRPAVFIFNHRNNFDGSFVAALVRTDYVSIAKADMAKNPVGKLVAAIMPTVFIERGEGTAQKAAEALQPVVEAVQKGYSIMLAPEGTRVSGIPGSVGPFKKGAFHMAIAAGIPIVPVVIRNALDVASRDGGAMRPGTVDIAVLPPVSTEGWEKANLGEKVEEVRQMFIDTLEDWPEPDEEESEE